MDSTAAEILAERIKHEREYTDQRFNATAKALDTATVALEKRLEGMNEFRAQLQAQTQTFVSNTEFDAKLEASNRRLAALEKLSDLSIGAAIERQRSSEATARSYALIAGGIGILSSIILHFIK